MKTYQLIAAVTFLAFVFAPGCGSDEPQAQRKPEPDVPSAGGEPAGTTGKATDGAKKYTAKEKRLANEQFKIYCTTCHGATGKGDGLAGQALNPRPRNWTDQEWQAKVTDQHLFEVIRDGGAAHGLSASMLANPSYANQPGVLWALVELVRKYPYGAWNRSMNVQL